MSKIFKPRRIKYSTATGTKGANITPAAGEMIVISPSGGHGTGKGQIVIGDGTTKLNAYATNGKCLVDDTTAGDETLNTLTSDTSTTVATALNNVATGKTLGGLFGSLKQAVSLLNTQVTNLNDDYVTSGNLNSGTLTLTRKNGGTVSVTGFKTQADVNAASQSGYNSGTAAGYSSGKSSVTVSQSVSGRTVKATASNGATVSSNVSYVSKNNKSNITVSNGATTLTTSTGTGNETFDIGDGYCTNIIVNKTNAYNSGTSAGYSSANSSTIASSASFKAAASEVQAIWSGTRTIRLGVANGKQYNYAYMKITNEVRTYDYIAKADREYSPYSGIKVNSLTENCTLRIGKNSDFHNNSAYTANQTASVLFNPIYITLIASTSTGEGYTELYLIPNTAWTILTY